MHMIQVEIRSSVTQTCDYTLTKYSVKNNCLRKASSGSSGSSLKWFGIYQPAISSYHGQKTLYQIAIYEGQDRDTLHDKYCPLRIHQNTQQTWAREHGHPENHEPFKTHAPETQPSSRKQIRKAKTKRNQI